MPNTSKNGKAPDRLMELLGAKAESLIAAWFELAGYWSLPFISDPPIFGMLPDIRKKTQATDSDMVLNLGYDNRDGEGDIPTMEVIISLALFGDLGVGDSPCPTILIRVHPNAGAESEDLITERFAFCGGTWATE